MLEFIYDEYLLIVFIIGALVSGQEGPTDRSNS